MIRGKEFIAVLWGAGLTSLLVLALSLVPPLAGAQLTSPNYKVDETFFGTGGELDASSTNYKAKQSTGELGVGNSASTNYQAQAGFNTDRHEYLEFDVSNTSLNLGTLSTGSTASTSATFTVKAYRAAGYVVTTESDPPKSGTATLQGLTTPTAATPGTEQFGINLVANTSPSIGANPVQLPDSSFSFGTAATGYNTANLFKYVKGNTVAQSTKSSGTTNYTISYIYNISPTTPAGAYTFNHILVATATF